jgi:hypothetical protein
MESAPRAPPHAADRGRRTSAFMRGKPPQGAGAIMEHRGHETGLGTAGMERAAARHLL